MTIQIVGAGVGRTGTHSLKVALEQLLGGTCHHMMEVFGRQDQIDAFTAAIDGVDADWPTVLADFTAIVDFPGSLFWRELADAFPDAPVLLSSRPAEEWYRSAINTIFVVIDESNPWMAAVHRGLAARFCADFSDKAEMIAAYESHNAAVRAAIPKERLIDWQPSDGWVPICEALSVPIPDAPFPLTNTTHDFRAMIGADPIEE